MKLIETFLMDKNKKKMQHQLKMEENKKTLENLQEARVRIMIGRQVNKKQVLWLKREVRLLLLIIKIWELKNEMVNKYY